MISTLRKVVEGNSLLRLTSTNEFGEVMRFSGASVSLSADTQFDVSFLFTNGKIYKIHIEEEYPEEILQGFVEGGSGGSGTVTTESYSDMNDYNDVK